MSVLLFLKIICGAEKRVCVQRCWNAVIAGAAADASSTEDTSPFIEFGDDDDDDFDVDEARRKQDEEFDFGAMMKQSAADSKQKESSQGLSLTVSLVVVCCH